MDENLEMNVNPGQESPETVARMNKAVSRTNSYAKALARDVPLIMLIENYVQNLVLISKFDAYIKCTAENRLKDLAEETTTQLNDRLDILEQINGIEITAEGVKLRPHQTQGKSNDGTTGINN